MAIIGQFTDSDITIDITDGNLNELTGIHVTFKQGGIVVDVTDIVIENEHRLIVPLSQVQTGKFKDYLPIAIQINYFNAFGKRRKSNIVEAEVGTNLLERIVNNE